MKKSLLISAMLIGSACASWAAEPAHLASSPYQGAEPQEGCTYYLYNVETGTWIDANDQIPGQWGTTGALTNAGMDFTVSKPDNYCLSCNFANNGSLRGVDASGASDFGLDQGVFSKWIIEKKTDSEISNAYTIRVEANDDANEKISSAYYLSALWLDGNLQFYALYRGTANDLCTWQFVTREERLAQMKKDAEANPDGVDATWLIPNHNMVSFNLRDDQCWQGITHKHYEDSHMPDFVNWEAMNEEMGGSDNRGLISHELWNGTMDIYTVIEGLPEGSYSYSISGFYREGNPWNSHKTAGPFNNKAWYYAGGSAALVMNVFDDALPAEDKAQGFVSAVDGKWFPTTTAGRAFRNGYYKNAPVTTNVSADGKLILGLWKGEVIGEDSFNFKQMHLTYKATKVDEDPAFKAQLKDLIACGENYPNLPGMTDAIAGAKAALNGSATDMMLAMRPLTAAASSARTFEHIKALCPEGTDISKAQAMMDAAQNDADVQNAIRTLRGIRRRAESTRIEDKFQGVAEIPAEGKFYLYNVGQQQFLDGGGEWSGHTILDTPGAEFTALEINGLSSKLSTNFVANNGNNHYLASWGSLDGDQAHIWEFIPVEGQENMFKIHLKDGQNYLIYEEHAPNDSYSWYCERTVNIGASAEQAEAAGSNAWWKIVPASQRDALMATASVKHPVDVSHHILNPGFNRIITPITPEAWAKQGASFNIVFEANINSETIEATNIVKGEFELSQQIANMPDGVYKIECNGFYRDGNLLDQANADPVKPVILFCDAPNPDAQVEICNILEEADNALGEGTAYYNEVGSKKYEIPEDARQASAYYRAGLYKNYVVAEIRSEVPEVRTAAESDQPAATSTIKFGVKYPADSETDAKAGMYLNLDNFRISYYGAETSAAAVKDYIVTGITDIFEEEPAAAAAKDNRIFNLQGIEVKNPTAPGIYISNGKKFVIR